MAEAAPLYASGSFDEVDHEGTYLSDDEASLHETDYTETSLTSDGEDEDVDEDEDVGLQAALAASTLEMENALRQEELELQRAVEASKDADQDERTFKEMRKVQEAGLGRFPEEPSSVPFLHRPSSASSMSTVSSGDTASRSRHHPFLSPPASIIYNPNKTIPTGFNSLEANIAVPIDINSRSTVTDIDISAYPLLPESPSTSSTNLQLPYEKDTPAYVARVGQRSYSPTAPPPSRSSPKTPLPSNVRPDVFHAEDAVPFPQVSNRRPAQEKPQHEGDFLPQGIHTIPIQTVGGTEMVNIPVRVENELGRASHPPRKVTLRSPSPSSSIYPVSSPASAIGDVPFPEVEPSKKRVPPTYKRSHECAFSTRSAHMTYVSNSTTTNASIQGETGAEPSSVRVGMRSQGSDDTAASLFMRLAVPPSLVPSKTSSLPSRHFLASDLLADVEPRMSLQLFRTTTRPLFSDQCLCMSCGAIFVHNLEKNVPVTRITMPSALHGSLICYCESCGVDFCHGCRRPQSQCEKLDTCRPRIATAIFRIISLIDIELLRLGGPERVNQLFATSIKRQQVANALSTIVAYLNHSTHMQHYYLLHLINLSLLPVIFEYLLERPPKLWIETRATEDLYNQMLAFLMISLDVVSGEILLQQRGRFVQHKGMYEMMQDTGGITWDNSAPVRSFADIIEGIYPGDFMKEAEDYISRSRHLFDHLSDHVNHVKHLFDGVDRLRMTDDSGKAITTRRSNSDVVL
ncbi:hypothetical protein EV421DRAFT_1908155 [Armillaria borealis]|uniref:Uncharacterized protein n=1 Tax=Armillaria borealis TaxID=47425 RepID=A0AA39J6I4_9AGAR|nr:hypothetical protein EV421DRAFT_1908155 [Armillaria borealis]